jgi:hypothetical protein
MLSTEYRLRLEGICAKIVKGETVELSDMIWAEKLAKANGSAGEMLRRARRKALNPKMQKGSLDDFLNTMDLGDPNPNNHKTSFDGAHDIEEWFRRNRPDDWRTRD